MSARVWPAGVLVGALVAGCSGRSVPAPSEVVDTAGGFVLVTGSLPADLDLAGVRAGGTLRMIGGRFGCLGFVRGIEDVVVLFPPGSTVHLDDAGSPSVVSAGHRYGVGDVVDGQPLNPQPVHLPRVSAFDRALPTNCVGFAGQAFVDIAPG